MNARERERARRLEQDLTLLVPIAKRLARSADEKGDPGITVEHIQDRMRSARLILAYRDREYLSRVWGAVMIRAKLDLVKGRSVRTKRRGTKGGNRVSLWRRAA